MILIWSEITVSWLLGMSQNFYRRDMESNLWVEILVEVENITSSFALIGDRQTSYKDHLYHVWLCHNWWIFAIVIFEKERHHVITFLEEI